MTAKEYLRQLHLMRRQIQTIQNRIDELYYAASGVGAIRYDKDRVQTSPDDYLLVHMAELDELETKYKSKLIHYHRAVQKIMDMIDAVEDPVYIQLLTLRYVDGMSFEKIACEMNYTYRHTVRLHGQALQAFTTKHQAIICP